MANSTKDLLLFNTTNQKSNLKEFTSLNGVKYKFNHNEIEFDYCSLCKYLELSYDDCHTYGVLTAFNRLGDWLNYIDVLNILKTIDYPNNTKPLMLVLVSECLSKLIDARHE